MKIGIDARFWGQAGPGRYVKNLVLSLQKVDEDNDYVIFLKEEREEGLEGKEGEGDNFRKVVVNVPWYSFAEQIKLPFILGRENLDLLHVPFFNIPLFYPGKIAVTIHDLTIHRFSTARATTRWRPFNLLKRLIYLFVFWVALKRAAVIFTPTEFVKKDLLDEYGWLDRDKIIVTYEGVEENFKLQIPNDKLPGDYSVKKPYLLYVGSMYPHKNLNRLVESFRLVSEEYPELSLVLVGKLDYFQRRLKKDLRKAGSGMQNAENIVFPAFSAEDSYVRDEDLAVIYKNALAFVFPSLSEGFGLPPLEAMQFGTPVCASNATAIPEVCGDAALYVDPRDVEDIAAKLKGIVKNSKLRKDLVAKGYKNLERFSWEKMAKKTLDGYRKVTEI